MLHITRELSPFYACTWRSVFAIPLIDYPLLYPFSSVYGPPYLFAPALRSRYYPLLICPLLFPLFVWSFPLFFSTGLALELSLLFPLLVWSFPLFLSTGVALELSPFCLIVTGVIF